MQLPTQTQQQLLHLQPPAPQRWEDGLQSSPGQRQRWLQQHRAAALNLVE